jgi:hypothetical protein
LSADLCGGNPDLSGNQGYLPPRHKDPPASPKAKPMAGRHEGFYFVIRSLCLGGEKKKVLSQKAQNL